jgi:hypothetical protein
VTLHASVTSTDASKWHLAGQPKKRSFAALPFTPFGGRRSGESDPHKTFEFSARKSFAKKRTKIRNEPEVPEYGRLLGV